MDTSIKNAIKPLQIVYFALIAGVLAFLLVSLIINSMSGPFMPEEKEMMQLFIIISILMGIASLTAGIALARKKLEGISKNLSDEQRIEHYRPAMILRAALMEAPAFFFIVCNLLFANMVFSIGAFVCVAVMMAYFPTKARIGNEVGVQGF